MTCPERSGASIDDRPSALPYATRMSHSNAFATPPAEPRLGVYNFSAGPSHMPIEVVDRVREELIDLSASGIGLGAPHRGPEYGDANEEAEAVIRRLAGGRRPCRHLHARWPP